MKYIVLNYLQLNSLRFLNSLIRLNSWNISGFHFFIKQFNLYFKTNSSLFLRLSWVNSTFVLGRPNLTFGPGYGPGWLGSLFVPGWLNSPSNPDWLGSTFIPDRLNSTFTPDQLGLTFALDRLSSTFVPNRFGLTSVSDRLDLTSVNGVTVKSKEVKFQISYTFEFI